MAIVQSGRHANDWLIDDKIQVESFGRMIRLRDNATGEVIRNGGKRGDQLSPTGSGLLLTADEWATYQSLYGDAAESVAMARYLIDSGKWALHEGHVNYNVSP